MALRKLLLGKQLEGKRARMAELEQRTTELEAREAELTAATDEASTDEELRSVGELIEQFTAEQTEHRSAVEALAAEIAADEEELRSLEAQAPKAAPAPNNNNDPQTGA